MRINIPPPSASNNMIVVAGEKEGVAAVVAHLRQLVAKLKATTKKMEIQIPKTQHRYVIGPRGDGLADVLDKTNVSVEVPPEDADNENITLRGEPAAIALALPLVCQKAQSVITRELRCPLWLHRHIIGLKGAGIRAITEHHPKCQVSILCLYDY